MKHFHYKKYIFFNTILIFFFANVQGQVYTADLSKKKDSLRLLIQSTGSDTIRCNALTELIDLEEDDEIWPAYNQRLQSICEEQLQNHKPQTVLHRFYLKHLGDALNNKGYLANVQGDIPNALKFFNKSLEIDESLDDKKGIATALNNLATVYQYQGDIQKALEYNSRSLDLRQKVDDKIGIAESFNNLGLIYHEQGNIPKAIEHYQKALKLQEQINDKKVQAATLNNIGQIYSQQDDTSRALKYYLRSLKINEEINERTAMAGCLHNIAHIFYKQKNIPLAVEYFEKSYSISESTGNKAGMAHSLNSLASLYSKQGESSRALDLWNRSLKLREEINDQQGITMSLNNLATAYYNKGDFATAERLSQRGLQIALALGFPGDIIKASGNLRNIYSKTGDWKKAYQMLELYKKMNDSINKMEDRKAALQMSFQYEYEKKSAADSVRVVEERKVFEAQLQQQKTQRAALYVVISLVTLFAFFMFNRFRVTQKQKRIIEIKEKETQQQKFVIEQKHREISDSINYAERIQRSFLASTEILNSNLSEYFIFYQPKDVVSGDFYWATKLANDKFAFAVADSTGHGVPGAIMSLLNIMSLEKASELLTDPADILNHTRKTIIQRLQKDGSEEGGKDGMDCSLLVFDFNNLKLYVAAANNPVLIVKSSNKVLECVESKFDKMPVGKHDNDQVTFTTQTIDLHKGDMIYVLTDGFADQFGGPRGKKFMNKQLKEVFITIANEPAPRQKKILSQTLKEWQGDLEQVDDMTIVGIRV